MKKILLSKSILGVFVLSALMLNSLSAANWFVKPNASGTGASWDNPCNLSVIAGTPAGIADGDVVYVAAGTYESSTSKTIAKYISIYGGYPANSTGTDLPTRNLVADSTIFVPSTGGTARCLVLNATTAPSVAGQKIVLDGLHLRGFTMTTGNGGTAISITTAQSDIDFKNLSFKNNISLNASGGAFYMGSFAYNITISFDNCNFINNQATYTSGSASYGGAAYFNNGTTAKTINFTNCNFKSNKAYMRAAAVYMTQSLTAGFTDCTFDSNQLTIATDAQSSGGCFYISSGGSAGVTLNATRCIFLNSNSTQYGSVVWFNTTPKNTLNMTDCSLIGNYASRTTSSRGAIDCSSYATILGGSLTGCVLSNYNYGGSPAGKQSNKADVMYLTGASTDVNFAFSNSILNGTYFSSSNVSAAVSPSVLYTTTGYLKDSTIALALSGDLKITDKIVFNKTFVGSANVGSYIHTQIFDVKRNTGKAMTFNATIPYGYKITVDGADYQIPGLNVIQIPISASDPIITFSSVVVTENNMAKESNIKISNQNDILSINGVQIGTKIGLYNSAGQSIINQVSKSETLTFTNLHNGIYILAIGSERLKFVK